MESTESLIKTKGRIRYIDKNNPIEYREAFKKLVEILKEE